jgi:hypothetical protein
MPSADGARSEHTRRVPAGGQFGYILVGATLRQGTKSAQCGGKTWTKLLNYDVCRVHGFRRKGGVPPMDRSDVWQVAVGAQAKP